MLLLHFLISWDTTACSSELFSQILCFDWTCFSWAINPICNRRADFYIFHLFGPGHSSTNDVAWGLAFRIAQNWKRMQKSVLLFWAQRGLIFTMYFRCYWYLWTTGAASQGKILPPFPPTFTSATNTTTLSLPKNMAKEMTGAEKPVPFPQDENTSVAQFVLQDFLWDQTGTSSSVQTPTTNTFFNIPITGSVSRKVVLRQCSSKKCIHKDILFTSFWNNIHIKNYDLLIHNLLVI